MLLDAAYTGEDPLGGVDAAGTGMVLEGGFEAEYFLDRSMSLRLRGLARSHRSRPEELGHHRRVIRFREFHIRAEGARFIR